MLPTTRCQLHFHTIQLEFHKNTTKSQISAAMWQVESVTIRTDMVIQSILPPSISISSHNILGCVQRTASSLWRRTIASSDHTKRSYLKSGTHFTNNFSITIQIRWKFHLALITLLVIISQRNLAHATTAQLSCHVPNIVAITVLVFGWEQNEISITFELWWKNC